MTQTDQAPIEQELSETTTATARPSRTRRMVIAIGATLALVLGAVAMAWQPWAGLPDGAAFAVGDRAVTAEQLDERVETLRALYGVVPPEDPAALDAFRRDTAKSVAVSMLLDRLAAERNIVVPAVQARDVLDRFIASRYRSRAAFVQSLGEAGTSEPQVLAEITRQLTVGRLMDSTSRQVRVSDAELRAEFERRKDTLGVPERRTLRNIVVRTREDAQAVVSELRAGVPFATVAARHSLDGSTRRSGGLLGTLSERELAAPVAAAAFAVGRGELYGPVRGKYGWNIGRVDAIEPARPPEFAQVRDALREQLRTERAFEHWRSWLGRQIHEADISYADRYRPAHPDAPPSSDISGTAGVR